MVDVIRVESTSLQAVGYDEATRVLYVQFRAGGIYAYQAVPASIYNDLLRAPSVGRFFNEMIRDRFPFQEIGCFPS